MKATYFAGRRKGINPLVGLAWVPKWGDLTPDWRPELLASVLFRAQTQFRDSPAVAHEGTTRTYGELGERVGRLAGALLAGGLYPCDRVAVIAPNCPWMLESSLAAASAGLVLLPLNVRSNPSGLARLVRHSRARALLAHSSFEALAKEVHGLLQPGEPPMSDSPPAGTPPSSLKSSTETACRLLLEDELTRKSRRTAPARAHQAAPDAAAQIYYTSGTTGDPKGVILTHRNVATHALMAISALELGQADVWAHIAPMFHLADAWATFAITWVGGCHRFLPRYTPEDSIDLLASGTTITNLVPTMLSDMVHCPQARRPYPGLRAILSGGAPIASALVDKILEIFGCRYIQTYGLTETAPFLTMSILPRHLERLPEPQRRALVCKTGRPLAGVEVEVVREDGSEVRPDGREVGEVRARGDSVTPGYFDNPEATKAAIRDGWLYTGDLAVVDEHGFLNIVDRRKDTIKSGAETVFSSEVEQVFYAHPAVREAAVIGLPHPRWGEAVVAIVVLKPAAEPSEEQLLEHCRAHLGGAQIPKRILFKPSLPRTGSNKIAKRLLREELAQMFS